MFRTLYFLYKNASEIFSANCALQKNLGTCLHQAIIEENKVNFAAEKNPMKMFHKNTAEFLHL